MLDILKARLFRKQEEYNERMKSFKLNVETESDTSCFERNAINELLVLQILKAEIEELKYAIDLEEMKSGKWKQCDKVK